MDTQAISVIIGIFIGLGTLIAGIGFAYAQYKTGGDRYKDNLIDTLKDTAEVERSERERLTKEKTELLISHQGQINELTKQLSELKGRFDEQVKKANEYQALILNRDPILQETLQEIRAFLKTLTEQSNDNTHRSNNEIKKNRGTYGK